MILLQCLKILGFVLLGILGLALLILILVLAVPIRMDLKLRYEEEVRARARVHWLLKAVLVKLEWLKDHGLLRVVLLGIWKPFKKKLGDWGPEDEPPEEAAEAEPEEPAEPTAEADADADTPADAEPAEEAEAEPAEGPEAEGYPCPEIVPVSELYAETLAETSEEDAPESDAGNTEDAAGEKSSEGLADKLAGLEDKLAGLEEKLLWFLDMLQEEKNHRALELVKRQLKRIGKHLLPTELLIEGSFGTGNPAKTGELMGKLYRLYPLYGDHIRVTGVYDRKELKGYVALKERIRLGIFLGAALRLLLNRRIRQWIRYFIHKDDPEKAKPVPGAAEQKRPEEVDNGR